MALTASICVSFNDNLLVPLLFGDQDKYLTRIEDKLSVSTFCRGNVISISGNEADVLASQAVLEYLYEKLESGAEVTMKDVNAAIRLVTTSPEDKKHMVEKVVSGSKQKRRTQGKLKDDIIIKTPKKHIVPFSHNQKDYMKLLREKALVFSSGPAGTGKTYLAVAEAVEMLINHKLDRIILSRPAVEAGEKLGFLPGDLKDKVDPYLRPLYDALYDMLPAETVHKLVENGEIEIAPLAFMRGRTLNNAFVILDEAQNSTPMQMKMFLTRMGEGCRMVVNGDLSQTDLPRDIKSGLRDALEKLHEIPEVGFIHFSDQDTVRHPLTAKIVKAYESLGKWSSKNNDDNT